MESDTKTGACRKLACATCGQEFENPESTNCPNDGTRLTFISQQLAPGTILAGRFEIIESVADGGMGTVYKAKHTLMKRIVAIKTMQPYLVASGSSLKRFQQEAQALSSLNHPHILSVFDFFVGEDGLPYLVMDYLEGTNLSELVRDQGPMSWQRATRIFADVCSALAHAHAHGIIHRDVKPSNVMLVNFDGKDDFVKVIDFGIAKLTPQDGQPTAGLTATGDTFGSPQYMSPEQCRAKPLDDRSDIYSLGCVMYSVLTGVPPFAGGDSIECMFKHVNDQPEPFNPPLGIPPVLEELVMKALRKDPDDRWQSMVEMRTALESLLVGTTQSASPVLSLSSSQPNKLQDKTNVHLGSQAERVLRLSKGNNVTEPSASSSATGEAPESKPAVVPDPAVAPAPATKVVAGSAVLQNSSAQGMSDETAPIGGKRIELAAIGGVVVVCLCVGFIGLGSFFSKHEAPPASTATTVGASPTAPGQPQQNPTVSTSVQDVGNQSQPAVPNGDTGQPQPVNAAPAASQAPVVQQTPNEVYQQAMALGEKAFRVCDYNTASRQFNAAHSAASTFGEADARYIDSLDWQGKVAYKQGNYQAAQQAINWVIYARKRHSSAKAGLPADEALLREIKKALRR